MLFGQESRLVIDYCLSPYLMNELSVNTGVSLSYEHSTESNFVVGYGTGINYSYGEMKSGAGKLSGQYTSLSTYVRLGYKVNDKLAVHSNIGYKPIVSGEAFPSDKHVFGLPMIGVEASYQGHSKVRYSIGFEYENNPLVRENRSAIKGLTIPIVLKIGHVF